MNEAMSIASPADTQTVTRDTVLAERRIEVYGLRRPLLLQEQEAALSPSGGVIGPFGNHAVRITQAEGLSRVAAAINARATGGAR